MRPAALGGIRARAVEEAQKAQRGVVERAVRAREAAPPYVLVELIGKGGYGRVYKGLVLGHCETGSSDLRPWINSRTQRGYADGGSCSGEDY